MTQTEKYSSPNLNVQNGAYTQPNVVTTVFPPNPDYAGDQKTDILVSSVSNSDGTLTITPTSGNVVASVNLAHANTWTATQTFNTAITLAHGQGINFGTDQWDVNITGANSTFASRQVFLQTDFNTINVLTIGNGLDSQAGATALSSYNNTLDDGSGNMTAAGVVAGKGFKTTAGASTTISVGASPYTYTNSSTSNQQLFIQGGTVSAISFNPNGTSGISLSGLTDNILVLRPNDTVTVTYTAAPTMTTVQL